MRPASAVIQSLPKEMQERVSRIDEVRQQISAIVSGNLGSFASLKEICELRASCVLLKENGFELGTPKDTTRKIVESFENGLDADINKLDQWIKDKLAGIIPSAGQSLIDVDPEFREDFLRSGVGPERTLLQARVELIDSVKGYLNDELSRQVENLKSAYTSELQNPNVPVDREPYRNLKNGLESLQRDIKAALTVGEDIGLNLPLLKYSRLVQIGEGLIDLKINPSYWPQICSFLGKFLDAVKEKANELDDRSKQEVLASIDSINQKLREVPSFQDSKGRFEQTVKDLVAFHNRAGNAWGRRDRPFANEEREIIAILSGQEGRQLNQDRKLTLLYDYEEILKRVSAPDFGAQQDLDIAKKVISGTRTAIETGKFSLSVDRQNNTYTVERNEVNNARDEFQKSLDSKKPWIALAYPFTAAYALATVTLAYEFLGNFFRGGMEWARGGGPQDLLLAPWNNSGGPFILVSCVGFFGWILAGKALNAPASKAIKEVKDATDGTLIRLIERFRDAEGNEGFFADQEKVKALATYTMETWLGFLEDRIAPLDPRVLDIVKDVKELRYRYEKSRGSEDISVTEANERLTAILDVAQTLSESGSTEFPNLPFQEGTGDIEKRLALNLRTLYIPGTSRGALQYLLEQKGGIGGGIGLAILRTLGMDYKTKFPDQDLGRTVADIVNNLQVQMIIINRVLFAVGNEGFLAGGERFLRQSASLAERLIKDDPYERLPGKTKLIAERYNPVLSSLKRALPG